MKKLLKSRRGESLTEALVAVLVIAVASGILVSMLNVSLDLTKRAKTGDAQYYEDLSAAEQGGGESRTVTVSIYAGGTYTLQKDVDVVACVDAGGLTSYEKEVAAP